MAFVSNYMVGGVQVVNPGVNLSQYPYPRTLRTGSDEARAEICFVTCEKIRELQGQR